MSVRSTCCDDGCVLISHCLSKGNVEIYFTRWLLIGKARGEPLFIQYVKMIPGKTMLLPETWANLQSTMLVAGVIRTYGLLTRSAHISQPCSSSVSVSLREGIKTGRTFLRFSTTDFCTPNPLRSATSSSSSALTPCSRCVRHGRL